MIFLFKKGMGGNYLLILSFMKKEGEALAVWLIWTHYIQHLKAKEVEIRDKCFKRETVRWDTVIKNVKA